MRLQRAETPNSTTGLAGEGGIVTRKADPLYLCHLIGSGCL